MIGKISQNKSQVFIKKNSPAFLLILVFSLYALVSVYKMSKAEYFFSYDPFYHYYLTLNFESQTPFRSGVENYEGVFLKFDYPTIYRSLLYYFSLISGIDLLIVFKYFTLVLRLITGLAVYNLVKFLSNRTTGIIVTFLILFSPYLFYRGFISYPENMVLLFHIMIFHQIAKGIRSKQNNILCFALIGFSLITHYRSIIIPMFTFVLFQIYLFYLSIKNKYISKFIFQISKGTIVVLIIALPVLLPVITQYADYFQKSIGSNSELSKYVGQTVQYEVPGYLFYIDQLGYWLVFMLIMSVVTIRIKKSNFEFIVFLIFSISTFITFILTQGPKFGVYVPPLRMFSYMILASIPLISINIKYLLDRLINKNYLFGFYLLFFLTTTLSALKVEGWVGMLPDDLKAGDFLNNEVNADSVVVWDRFSPISLGVKDIKVIEPNFFINREILHSSNREGIKSLLNKYYSGRSVFVVTDQYINSLTTVYKTQRLNVYKYE